MARPMKNLSGGLGAGFRQRYLEVVASIYIYNEHRGYTSLDRVLEAVRKLFPGDTDFIAAIERHRDDERKHYVMFKRWFELQGRMPLAVNRDYGHIDRFVGWVFGTTIDDLDTAAVASDPSAFERLCRVISLTEQRGLVQVESVLRNRIIRSDPVMTRIFQIVHRDEPSHFEPYCEWLAQRGRPQSMRSELMADWCIHKLLMLVKLPTLFLAFGAARMQRWPDAAEIA